MRPKGSAAQLAHGKQESGLTFPWRAWLVLICFLRPPAGPVQVFATAGDTYSGAALSSTHQHLASADGGRDGDGCWLEERAGPSVWARRWGSHRGDTPRCFSRRRLRAKHGGRSAFALERTVVSCFLLSHAVTPAGTEREDSQQGQSSDLSH